LELTAKRNVLIKLKEHYYVLLQNKKNMLNHVAWFYAEACRAQKQAPDSARPKISAKRRAPDLENQESG
jgi:hypothetical protein